MGPSTAPPSTAPPSEASPNTVQSSVHWSACGPSLECGAVRVPLDYAHPEGRQISIALERHRATDLPRLGSLLVNPGGPGESGIDSMDLFLAILSPQIVSHFDIVAFDPRGVGRSDAIRCLSDAGLDRYFAVDPEPITQQGFDTLVAADRTLVAGCAARSGALLAFVDTRSAARDLDRIRAALGEQHLDYFGFSYGTLLGATYAELFGANVGVMVLDGAVDPAVTPVAAVDAQSQGFQRSLADFFAWCASSPSSCEWAPGGDLHRAFEALLGRLRTHPLVVGDRQVGLAEAFLGVATPLYDQRTWPVLGQALAGASQGDGALLLALFDSYVERQPDGSYHHILEANTAISCADQPWSTDLGAYPPLAAQAARLAPDFGEANIYGSLVCALWPVHGLDPPHAIHAPDSPPIVVVGSTGDPATPYAWARSLAAELAHGVLVTRVGQGHTGYRASACVRAAVDAYLLGGHPPAPGTTCTT